MFFSGAVAMFFSPKKKDQFDSFRCCCNAGYTWSKEQRKCLSESNDSEDLTQEPQSQEKSPGEEKKPWFHRMVSQLTMVGNNVKQLNNSGLKILEASTGRSVAGGEEKKEGGGAGRAGAELDIKSSIIVN